MSIVADTSAFLSIFLEEEDSEIYKRAMMGAGTVFVSAATGVELHIVVTSKMGTGGILSVNRLLDQSLFRIVPLDVHQMVLASHAYERFGKGRHPAKLNYGDLFSYALAKSLSLPLLFKGNDFSKTDLVSCIKTS